MFNKIIYYCDIITIKYCIVPHILFFLHFRAVNKKSVKAVACPRDTGAGFFVEEEDEVVNFDSRPIVSQPAPLFVGDRPLCLMCNEEFSDSYLQKYFDHNVCDSCR